MLLLPITFHLEKEYNLNTWVAHLVLHLPPNVMNFQILLTKLQSGSTDTTMIVWNSLISILNSIQTSVDTLAMKKFRASIHQKKY